MTSCQRTVVLVLAFQLASACQPPCSETGNIIIASQADADALASCSELGGPLLVNGASDLTTLDFPKLEVANGKLDIADNPRLTRISFPALRTVSDASGGAIRIENNGDALRSVSFPSLESAGDATDGRYGFYIAAALETLDLSKLRTVGGADGLTIANTQLSSISLPAFEQAMMVTLRNNAALTRFDAPKLEALDLLLNLDTNGSLEDLHVPALRRIGFHTRDYAYRGLMVRNSGLATLSLPGLEYLKGQMVVAENIWLTDVTLSNATEAWTVLQIEDNARLVSFSSLQTTAISDIGIHRNPKLERVSLPALQSLDVINAADNPVLPQCVIDDLKQVRDGKAGSSTCP